VLLIVTAYAQAPLRPGHRAPRARRSRRRAQRRVARIWQHDRRRPLRRRRQHQTGQRQPARAGVVVPHGRQAAADRPALGSADLSIDADLRRRQSLYLYATQCRDRARRG
jgi:hypothetical protein